MDGGVRYASGARIAGCRMAGSKSSAKTAERNDAVLRMWEASDPTYSEIGEAFGLSVERVRQIITKGYRRHLTEKPPRNSRPKRLPHSMGWTD